MIVNVMQIVTVIVNMYIAVTEKKKRIYIATFLLNLSQLIIYFLNNDLTTALIYIVIVIRSLIYIYKDNFKTNIIPYLAILIQLIIGYFTIENAIQILSVLIPCYSCWYLWFHKDTQKLRIGNIISNTAWAVYNIYNGLYILLIMRSITIGSNAIVYIRRKNICQLQGKMVQYEKDDSRHTKLEWKEIFETMSGLSFVAEG